MSWTCAARNGCRVGLIFLSCVILHGRAAAVDLRAGNLIVTDRSADPFGFGDSRGSLTLIDETSGVPVKLIASPAGFVDPQAAITLSDGRILAVDSNSDPFNNGQARGALWLLDPQEPQPGVARLLATNPQWETPIDILQEPSGTVLMLDADADPNSIGSRPGALYRVGLDVPAVALLATSPFWVEPRSMVFDRDGSVLIWDARADPLGIGGAPGALFRVNPLNGAISVVFSAAVFTTPWAVALDRDGDFLILDRNANPAGHPGAPGAIFRVRRVGLTVEPIVAPVEFVEPFDLVSVPDGSVWVLDNLANPFGYPDALGAVFKCDPASGDIDNVMSSGFFRSVIGLSLVAGSTLDSSLVRWADMNGAPIQPGDRMRVRVRVRNTGDTPAQLVRMEHEIGPLFDYLVETDSIGTGSFTYDPSTRIVRWVGDVGAFSHVDLAYDLRLKNDLAAGTELSERIVLRLGRTGTIFGLSGVVRRRSEPGRFAWVDTEPVGGGSSGVIWEMPAGALRPERIYDGPPFVQPSDLAFLLDGRIAVLDRRSAPLGPGQPLGGIFVVDPFNGSIDTLLAFGEHPELRTPLGIAPAGLDELLLIDKDANPLELPGAPGGVFSLSIATGELRLIASDPRFSEPADAILETSGTILLVDFDANPSGQSPRGGGLFEIDPLTGGVRALTIPPGMFVDPTGLTEGFNRRVFVADVSADPDGIGGNTGAIFEIQRSTGDQILVASADSIYVDPSDVVSLRDGSLIVTDREANPFDLPPRDRGAVFRVRPHAGPPTIVTADPLLYGPEAVASFEEGDLVRSAIEVLDLDGSPSSGGDTLRFDALVRNSGKVPVAEALATLSLSSGLSLVGAEGPGEIIIDPVVRTVTWMGPVGVGETVTISARGRVAHGLPFGYRVSGRLDLSGPGSGSPDSISVAIVAPLTNGDMVLSDANADPGGLGDLSGALFLLSANPPALLQPLMTDTTWSDPTSVEGYPDLGKLLMSDSGAPGSPGRVMLLDYLSGTTSPYIEDDRLGDPNDLLVTRAGDLLIVDPQADLGGSTRTGAIFVRRSGGADLEILLADSTLRGITQVAEDDDGRLWLVDRRGDPNGAEEGRGAVFQVDPVSGALLDTLQFPVFFSPTGVLAWPGEGLIVIDELAPNDAGGTGTVFKLDVEARSLTPIVSDRRFRLPRNGAFSSSGELWLIDRLARNESLPGSPRTLFRWDPETGVVDMVASSSSYRLPTDLYVAPGPNPRLISYEVDDLNGEPLQPGDEVELRAEVGNFGPIATSAAVYSDTIPFLIAIDRESIRANAGVVLAPENLNGLNWTIDLPPGARYSITYSGRVRPNVLEGLDVFFRAHLRSEEGIHRIRRDHKRFPVYFQDGYAYCADADADPFGLGYPHGAIWKIDLSTALLIPMLSSSLMMQPMSVLSVPTEPPSLYLVDSNANPMGFLRGRGSIWQIRPESAEPVLVAADSTFRSPRTAVPLGADRLLMLDATADPFGLGLGLGPGAVYDVAVPAGTVTPFASDTLLSSPRDLLLDDSGGALIIDADADPARFGLRNGAVFRLDLEQRRFSVYATSADFRTPVAGAIGPDGMLYVLDRDYPAYPNSMARGAVFRVDSLGNVTFHSSSRMFREPTDLQFDSVGRLFVTDTDADPYNLGGQFGAIFRLDLAGGEYRVFVAGFRFRSPGGILLRERFTAVELTGLEADTTSAGVRIRWDVPGSSQFDGFLCLRAQGANPFEEAYVILNPDEPVPGRGPYYYDDVSAAAGETYSYQVAGLLPGGGMRLFGPIVFTLPTALRFAFHPAAPNPVRSDALLRFDIPAAGRVKLSLFDPQGRRVRTLLDGTLKAGRHRIVWDGRNEAGHAAASGLFFARLEWSGKELKRRIVLLR